MPPKGSGKKGQLAAAAAAAAAAKENGDEDASTIAEEQQLLGIADGYELPRTKVQKLAKAALPENTKMSKDIPVALVKASTVFITYLTAISHDVAADRDQHTIEGNHVLEAVRLLGWDNGTVLLKDLRSELDAYRRDIKKVKDRKAAEKAAVAMEVDVNPEDGITIQVDAGAAPKEDGNTTEEFDEPDEEPEEEEEEEAAPPEQEEAEGT